MKQATKEVASAHPGSPSLTDQGPTGGWTRRLEPKRSVWAMLVGVLDIPPEDLLQVTTADDQQPVEALGTDRTDPTLRIGVRIRRLDRRDQHLGTLGPEHVVEPTTELGVAVAEHKAQSLSPSAVARNRLRACWATQAPSGLDVTPASWTRRVASSMKNSTYSRRSQMVSTVNKSQARMPAACWRRNARQLVAVGRGAGSSP
jgi:hypothetical protein